jgi:hypothetical protein
VGKVIVEIEIKIETVEIATVKMETVEIENVEIETREIENRGIASALKSLSRVTNPLKLIFYVLILLLILPLFK